MSKLPAARADEFIALLSERVSQQTLDHCVSVVEHMVSFADKAGITSEQAVAAGLLHDLCKAMSTSELIAAAERYGIEISALHKETPMLLHGPVAAEQCKRELGIDDPEVYDAIFWHTTGRAGWGPVGLALYVADFSEPRRTIPEAAETCEILERDGFKEALHFVVEKKLEFVRNRYTLDPASEDFAHWVRSEAV